MEFNEFVKNLRSEISETPTKFFDNSDLSISYQYYLNVESGKQIPKIKIAEEILRALNADVFQGLQSWLWSQISDPETKSAFSSMLKPSAGREEKLKFIDKSARINPIQSKLLLEDSIYWELIAFLAADGDLGDISIEKLSHIFGLPQSKIELFLKRLYEYGIIDHNAGNYRSKEWVGIPRGESFDQLREANLNRSFQQLQKLQPSEKHTSSITRRLTKKQFEEIKSESLNLINRIINMEDAPTDSTEIYSLAFIAGERIFGKSERRSRAQGDSDD